MEMEFDARALADSKSDMRDRLVTYIQGFERHRVFEEASIAYYEGGNGIYLFSKSTNPLDKELMDKLAAHIVERKSKKFLKSLKKSKKS